MSQLSLFSADARPARLGDLGGLLCGPARIDRFGGVTARVALPVAGDDRVAALRTAAAALGIALGPDGRSCAGPRLRTAYRKDLAGLARSWIGPEGKTVPPGFQLDGAGLRLWALAGGRPDGRGGYLLPLDPTAPGTHDAVITAVTRLGLPPARVQLTPCPACREAVREDVPLPDQADHVDHAEAPQAPGTTCRRHHGDPAVVSAALVLGVADAEHDVLRQRPAAPDPAPDTQTHPGGVRRHRTRSATVADDIGWQAGIRERPQRANSLPDRASPCAECAAAGPALRISGLRRIQRLVELVGPAPPGVVPDGWPRYWGSGARQSAG